MNASSSDEIDLTGDCDSIDILASDFLARYRDGDRPTIEEYARRHPEYGERIRSVFPLVASIERIKTGEQTAVDGRATLAGRSLSRLGDFRIVREIGRGGMGIVFEAQQESLGRSVAIKVLPRQCLLDEAAIERFRVEARTAAAMHHTNIVPIYGTGESDGCHYLVMQLVRGESLDTVIEKSDSDMPFADVARIGSQIADAIAYAHESGVLHRDIKPANILLEHDGTAQVTDFGLAKSIDSDPTMSRNVSGSLRYIAPERFAGVSDNRSDIYGIGLTLYELLTGSPAFDETDAEHLIGAITRPRLKPIPSIRPDIPADLLTIVTKAIQPDPSQRYQTSAELRDDLRRFLADEPIYARRLSLAARVYRWCRRNPWLALTIGITAFALTTTTIVSMIAYSVTSAANERSNNALSASEQTVDLALQSLDGVVEVVSQSPSLAGIGIGDSFQNDSLFPNAAMEPTPGSAKILERVQPIYERLSRQSPTRPDIVLQMIDASVQLARVQHSLGRTTDGIETLKRSLHVLDTRASSAKVPTHELHLQTARLNNELGGLYAFEFDGTQAQQCFRWAIESAKQLDLSNVAGQTELARAHLSLGDQPPNLRGNQPYATEQRTRDLNEVNQAIEVLDRLRDSSANKTLNILYARSLLARSRLLDSPPAKRRDFSDAVTMLREQLIATPDDSYVRFEFVRTLANVDLRNRSPNRMADAVERLEQSLQELQPLRIGSPDNAVVRAVEVHLLHKLASIARAQSRFSDASELLSEAIRLQTALTTAWPDNVNHLCWRAMLFRSQALLYRESGNAEAADAAVSSAISDVDAIDAKYSDYPMVIQTRATIQELSSPNTKNK